MPLDPYTHVRSRAVHTCCDTAAPSPSSMDVINAQLAQACSTIPDDEVADIIRSMAELLAASGPPYQLSWKDVRAELQFDLIKGLVKEVRLFKYFKVGYCPDGSTNPMTVQLLMDKVSADAAEAGLMDPAKPQTSEPASSSSNLAVINAQLARACSTITNTRDIAARLQRIAELLASIGPPYKLSWNAILAHDASTKGLPREVRNFKYFIVEEHPKNGCPLTVQLLMDKVSADAAEAGQAGGHGEMSKAPRASPDPATVPPAPRAAAPSPPPPVQAPQQAQANTSLSSVQGQAITVFQLIFSPAGLPIYTPSVTQVAASPCPPSPQPGAADQDAATIFNLLPPSVKSACADLGALDSLMELVLDMGRPPVLKLQGAKPVVLRDVGPVDLQEAVDCLVAAHKLNQAQSCNSSASSTWLSDMGSESDLLELSSGSEPSLQSAASTEQPATAPHGLFGPDKRLGIPGTLHRISAIRARDGSITGLTYRVGRHLPGMADMLSDVMHKVAQTMDVPRVSLNSIVGGGPSLPKPTSILVLGRPGLGKTTLLRDIARVLADEFELAVVVVDSSLEIGGAATVPHPALGAARRMEVRDRFSQQDVLIEAVQNHAPQVVVIDEIGTAKEVEAVKTIAQRGVAMVATAHGTDLMSIISNPVLAPLLGGVKGQTIGDQAAEELGGVKTRLQRTGPSCFTCLVELLDADTYRVHHNLEESVDMLLVDVAMKRAATSPAALREGWTSDERSFVPHTEIRQRQAAGQPVLAVFETQEAAARAGLTA